MARVSAELAYERRSRCWELRDQGLSYRAIASALQLPIASVQNYLATPPDSSVVNALARVVELKSRPEHAHRGALELRALAGADCVSDWSIERRVAHLARKGIHRSGGRAPYHIEPRPALYGAQWQVDTKKVRVGSVLFELLVIRDVHSGCTLVLHHSATQLGMLHKIAFALSVFDVIPRVVQADNGTTDFSMAARHLLRPWHELLLARGVERIQFIPEAQPHRNGSVESFNDWLQDEMDNHGAAVGVTPDTFDVWLADRMRYYNHVKPLGSTGVPPATLSDGRFDLDAVGYDIAYDPPSSGCVSFMRLGIRSVDRPTGAILVTAVIKTPGTVVVLPDELEGHYVRIDWHLDGRGEVWTPASANLHAAMAHGHQQRRGRLRERGVAGVLVARFVSPFARPGARVIAPVVDDQVADRYSAVTTDPAAVLRTWRKVLKQRIPQLLPSGIDLVVGADGCWEAHRNGDVLWTEQSSPEFIEHAAEAYC